MQVHVLLKIRFQILFNKFKWLAILFFLKCVSILISSGNHIHLETLQLVMNFSQPVSWLKFRHECDFHTSKNHPTSSEVPRDYHGFTLNFMLAFYRSTGPIKMSFHQLLSVGQQMVFGGLM